MIISTFLVSIIILFLLITKYKNKQKRLKQYYQDKFDDLIQEHKPSSIEKNLDTDKKSEYEIDASIVKLVYTRLLSFEDKKGFTKTGLKADSLAKELGTNSNYLSKVIKIKYDKTFREYINDLRIEHTLSKIRNEKKV